MSLKAIAVQGLTLAPQGIVSGGTITISSVPSTKVKAEGHGVYSGTFQFSIVGANATGYDPGTVLSVAPGVISPTAMKVKVGGQPVIRVDDQAPAVAMTGTIGGTPTPFAEPFKITDAGQTKVAAQ